MIFWCFYFRLSKASIPFRGERYFLAGDTCCLDMWSACLPPLPLSLALSPAHDAHHREPPLHPWRIALCTPRCARHPPPHVDVTMGKFICSTRWCMQLLAVDVGAFVCHKFKNTVTQLPCELAPCTPRGARPICPRANPTLRCDHANSLHFGVRELWPFHCLEILVSLLPLSAPCAGPNVERKLCRRTFPPHSRL